MANTLLTLNMVTKEAVRLWRNTNAFVQALDRQYDDQFARTGAKIGATLRIRLPVDYIIRTGATAVPQDSVETNTSLTIGTQQGVDIQFSTAEKTLSIDDFSERYLAPAMNTIAGGVAQTVMAGTEGGASNFVANQSATLATLSPNATTILNAGAALDVNSAGMNDQRWLIADPYTMARTVGTLAGLFNPAPEISRQYRNADIKDALGFMWAKDQTVIKHQTGTFSATANTVNGAGQTGTTLVVAATTGTLTKGDIITVAGVYAVNRITKQSTGMLRQFTVTAAVPAGSTAIPIYPAILGSTSGVAGGPMQTYQTTDSSPANGAVIALVNLPGEIYRKNIAFAPGAISMATADLYLPPKGIVEGSRSSYDSFSVRAITTYNGTTDIEQTRLDILYGYVFTRPDWVVVVGDAL